MASGTQNKVLTRKQTEVWLIGQISPSIGTTKLPSKKEVMALFFYCKQQQKQCIREACNSTSEAVLDVWAKAGIPTKYKPDIVMKIKLLFREWINLKKNKENKAKRSAFLVRKENEWQCSLDSLFDISHSNAMEMITIKEDKDFLSDQRDKCRIGKIGTVDLKLVKKKAAAEKRSLTFKSRLKKEQDAFRIRQEMTILESSEDENSMVPMCNENEDTVCKDGDRITPLKRGRKCMIDAKLAISLDVAKLSDRKAAKVLIPAMENLGHDPCKYNLNTSSIRRQRIIQRRKFTENFKASFKSKVPLTIHWDTKMMEDIIGRETVDRLPIVVSGEEIDLILGVPKLKCGTGEAIASAVCETAADWQICENIKYMSFDTTAVNTGPKSGACMLLEQKMGKEMLWLPCRHHIYELVLEAVVKVSLGTSSGPEILLFKRFQKSWPVINKTNFQTAVSDVMTSNAVLDISVDMISFAKEQLLEFQPRDDYKELLDLSIIFLGGVPVKGVSFKSPAGLHRARWMSKAIYSLKIWIFRNEFHLTKREETGVRNICLFVVKVYIKFWFQTTSAVSAPRIDLLFLKEIDKYSNDNKDISNVALNKFLKHLWYLSEHNIIFALFDDGVSNETKRNMIQAMRNPGVDYPLKKINVSTNLIRSKTLEDFVTANSRQFFTITGFPCNFLVKDVGQWSEDDEYRQVKNNVTCTHAVNDAAERGVALMEEYNKLHTNNQERKQSLLLGVNVYRKQYSNNKKSKIMENLKSLGNGSDL